MRAAWREAAWRRAAVALAALALILLLSRLGLEAQNFDLPGTQPTPDPFPSSAKIQHEFVPPFGSGPAGLQPCRDCHQGSSPTTQLARPLDPWHGSMMSQAARDPLFYAQLDLVNADAAVRPEVAGMGDMCLRCHSPVGWLEGRSSDTTGRSFLQKDLFGVQCHACHRMVDPSLAVSDPGHLDVLNILNGLVPKPPGPGIPPTFGNGMYVMDPRHVRRGPYTKAQMAPEHAMSVVGDGLDWIDVDMMTTLHPAMNSPFHRSGNLCGTCHDVSNPVDCEPGFSGQDTQKCFPIERTWTEWRHSAFFARGEAGNCQSCHMSGPLNSVGFGAPCEGGNDLGHLNDIHFHDLTGGNSFIPDVIKNLKARYDSANPNVVAAVHGLYSPPGASAVSNLFTNLNTEALSEGQKRVRRTLKRAAFLEVTAASATDLTARVTNRTGHKLPTGYPEGRRLWLRADFLDAGGTPLAVSGLYQEGTGSLYHDQNLDAADGPKAYDRVTYTESNGTARSDGRPTKVWEARLDHQATGTEFHFALNDRVRMDNRIPPEGWNQAEYGSNRAPPVIPPSYASNGWQTDYASGAHHDEVSYPLPAGTDRVQLRLYYQTASREYIEALAADNPGTLTAGTFNRGSLLADAWAATGRSKPEVVAERTRAIADTDGDGLSDGWETAHGLSASPLGGPNDDPDGDRLSNAQEFQKNSDPNDPDSPTPGTPRRPVDIVLVLDTSGSMNDPAPGTTTPKIQILKEAVTLFLDTWKDYASPDDRIGVVYFGTDAVPFGAAPLLKPFFAEWTNIRTDVQGRTAGGWTAMGAGTYLAIQGMGAFDPLSPRNRHVILFSNGMQNRSPMIVPFVEIPEFLVMQNQTSAENPEVTGGSNVTLPAPGWAGFPDAAGALVRVHTVGIGVQPNSGGTAWHELLRSLATQQQGKHNFITRAAELEGVFLQDLVESLKSNTLAYVLEKTETVTPTAEAVFEFKVNRSATLFSAALSWAGQAAAAPAISLVRPDGREEDLSRITRGGSFYRILTRFLDGFDEDPGQYGVWKLKVGSPRPVPQGPERTGPVGQGKPLTLRVHVLLDDRDVKYKFTAPARLRLGQPLHVKALATQGSHPLRMMDRVTVSLSVPGASVGRELARRRAPAISGLDPDIGAVPSARKAYALFSDEGFRRRLQSTEASFTLTDDGANGDEGAGDGIFSRTLLTPTVPGHYELRFEMVGHTLDGQLFTRQETHSIVVRIGPIDGARSGIHRVAEGGGLFVLFEPQDAAGNLLGPGYASLLHVRTGGQLLPVEDLLDGRYRARLPAGFDVSRPVRVGLYGTPFHDGAVPGRPLLARLSWWVWLLLILLVVIVVVVIVVLRRP
jgi:hypothetical protein